MNNKGFSLIELLAVITIIAIVALITYPVVGKVIENSNKNTFKSSVEQLIHICEMDYTEFARNNEQVYNYGNQKLTLGKDEIKYNGEIKNGEGTIFINKGKVTKIKIYNKHYEATLDEKGKVKVELKKE